MSASPPNQIPPQTTHTVFTTSMRQRVPFSEVTNTDKAQPAAASISPGFSCPFSITSFLNGEDDPLFPVKLLLPDDPSPSLDVGFDANLDALTNFLGTITPPSTTARRSLTPIDGIDCVMGMSSELTPLSMSLQHQQQLSSSGKSKQPDICAASSSVAHSEDARISTTIEATSWAAKNPMQPIAPTKARREISSKRPLANEVSSVAVKKRLAREKREAFAEDLSQGMEEHQERLEAIAFKHGKKFEEVLRIAGSASRYKSQRAVSDLQAKLLYQVKENNDGKPIGQRLRLAELRELAKTDPRCDELDEDELQSLKEEVYARRLDKSQGARVSHKSAAEDYRHTADLIESALTGLGLRTGARGFAVLSRGSVDDTMPPCLLQIPGSTAFLSTSIKVDPTDFIRQFEQFSCTIDDKPREDQASIRKDITRQISEGLEAITRVKDVNMNYQNYEKAIVLRYGVKLVGWPEQIPFGSPSNIRTMPLLMLLRRALRTTACRWTRLDETEIAELTDSIVNREVSGKVVGKKRKERSDKGGSHKPKKRKNREDHPQGQKHARKGASIPYMGTSRATENTNESDDNGEGDGDDDE